MLSVLIGMIAVLGIVAAGRDAARGAISASARASSRGARRSSCGAGALPVEIALWTLVARRARAAAHRAAADLARARRRRAARRGDARRSRTTASCCSSTRRRAARFRNSFGLSATAALVIVLIAVPLAYFLVWRRSRLLRVLNLVTEMPYALPGVVLAIAAILAVPEAAAGARPLALQHRSGSSSSATSRAFSCSACARSISGYHQLDRTLEEAAQIAGARLAAAAAHDHPAAGRAGGGRRRAAHLPHRVQRAHGVGAAVVVRRRDARRRLLLVPAGRRLDLRRGARRAHRRRERSR